MRRSLHIAAALLLSTLAWVPGVHAEGIVYQCEAQKNAPPAGEDEFERPHTPRVVEVSLGVKAGAGAEFWTSPTNTTLYVDPSTNEPFTMPFFDETRAGYNMTLGFFGELRVVQYVGVEVGLFFTRHKLLEDTDWTYTESINGNVQVYKTHTTQEVLFTKLRVPVLLKGHLPVGKRVRLSLGVGPEFAWNLYSRASFKVDEGQKLYGDHAAFQNLTAQGVDDVGLTTAAGVLIDAGVMKLPIEIRFFYNFSQPPKYKDRVHYDRIPPAGFPTEGAVVARESLYVQLLLGVQYDL